MKPEGFYRINGLAANAGFSQPELCKTFLQAVNQDLGAFCQVFAFCLVPTEFELLVKLNNDASCEAYLKSAGAIAKDYLTFEEPGGSILLSTLLKNKLSGFFSRQTVITQHSISSIDATELSENIAAIHLYPVKTGLCAKPEDWLYSSFNAFVSDKPTKIPREEVFQLLGGKAVFHQLHG